MVEAATVPADALVPAAPRINTLAAFARTLVLPVEHPLRLLLTGLVPATLAVIFVSEAVYGLQFFYLAWMTDLPLWLIGLLAVLLGTFWGCAWQRAVARRPAEPILRWLGGSLRQLPPYSIAAAVAILPPLLVWLFSFGMTYLIMAGGNLGDFGRGWWFVAGAFVLLLPGLWLFARLSLLPAVVAAHGWSGAVERTRALGQGRNFGLTLAFALLFLISFVLNGMVIFVFYRVFLAVISFSADPQGALLTYLFGEAFALTLFGSWAMGLPALIVRQETRADEIDPNAFD